jgi:hypothetical protein
MSLPAYRITEEDLPDADKRLRDAIRPLLDRLNRSLTLVITALNAAFAPGKRLATFTADGSGNAAVTLGSLSVTPAELWCTALVLSDGSAPTSYSMTWIPLTAGATVYFTGLTANLAYSFTVRYL